jgi:uncharacterized protein (DUF362 family)
MKKDEINRREFIKKSAQYSAYAAVGIAAPAFLKAPVLASQSPDIVVANGGAASAARAAVNALGGMKRFVKQGQKVVIKPNMSFSNPPEMATTTNPDVIRELVAMCSEAGAHTIHVLDNTLRDEELCLEQTGIRAVCRDIARSEVQAIEDKKFFEKVDIPDGRSLKSTRIMKKVLESDVLIAAPVAKSHGSSGVSLGMKGMMGLIHNRSSFHIFLDLHTAIVDLCTVLMPQLTVIDASRILSDGGPGGPGKVITLNKIIASTDVVAADAMAVEVGTWYGKKFKPQQIKHIKRAHDRGLGNMDTGSQVIQEVSA